MRLCARATVLVPSVGVGFVGGNTCRANCRSSWFGCVATKSYAAAVPLGLIARTGDSAAASDGPRRSAPVMKQLSRMGLTTITERATRVSCHQIPRNRCL